MLDHLKSRVSRTVLHCLQHLVDVVDIGRVVEEEGAHEKGHQVGECVVVGQRGLVEVDLMLGARLDKQFTIGVA